MPYKDKEAKKLYDAARYRTNLARLRELKVSRGCFDCGYNAHHAGLEFDHREDKKANIATMLSGTWAKLEVEIAKCDVVCGICHNIRTFNRRESKCDTMVVPSNA